MSELTKLRRLSQELLGHIGSLEEMRRGSVTRQFFRVKRKELNVPVLVGPYTLKKGKTVGRRLREPEEIRQLEEEVENYHVFRRLCSELVDVSEQICDEKDKQRR
jgi:hypothetical protein